ncbi:MAG: hypothetical protein V3R48_03095 [Thermoplasmata archaeon]
MLTAARDEKKRLLASLRARFESKGPFPRPPSDREIQYLHGDLAEYDFYSARDISRVLDGKKPYRRYERNEALEKRILGLLAAMPQFSEILGRYLEIYRGLQEMIGIAEKIRRVW